jgi:ArsR family transcriptional regulator
MYIDACQCRGMTRTATTAPDAATTLVESVTACCQPVLHGVLSQESAEQLASALRVVADPARLRLLSLLGAAPDGWACQCDLTAGLGLSQPTVSHHMKVLHEAGFVDREKRGQWVFYRLVPKALGAVRELLTPRRGGRR